MAYRILLELALFLSPFATFGVYRMLVNEAEAEGRDVWPIRRLFLVGVVLAGGVWVYFILREDRQRGVCREPARFEDGVLIPERLYPCEVDVARASAAV